MATKYVAPAAAGAGNGSDVDNPMSLKAAFAECTAGDTYKLASGTYTRGAGDNDWIINNESTASEVVFESATGNAADVIITSVDGFSAAWYGSVYVLATTNSVIVKFRNMTVHPGTGAGESARHAFYLRTTGAGNVTVTLDNCKITATDHDDSAGYAGVYTLASSTGRIFLTLDDTDVDIDDTALGLLGSTDSLGSLSVSGGDWTHTGTAGEVIKVSSCDGRCEIADITVTSSADDYALLFDALAASDTLYVHDVNVTVTTCTPWIVYVANYWEYVCVDNVTLTVLNNTTTITNGLAIGMDSQTPTEAMGQVLVRGVTIEYIGTTVNSGHGLLIGGGSDGAEVANNRVYAVLSSTVGNNLGLVIKAENCNIHHNIIVAADALYLKGGYGNHVSYNTFIATYGNAMRLYTDTDESKENFITHNILDASNGDYCIRSNSSGHFNNHYDFNDYVAGDEGLATFDNTSTKIANLTALQAYWSALEGTLWTNNDVDSVEVNPSLDANYRPRNRTVARMGIGAVAPTAQTLGGTGILEIAP